MSDVISKRQVRHAAANAGLRLWKVHHGPWASVFGPWALLDAETGALCDRHLSNLDEVLQAVRRWE